MLDRLGQNTDEVWQSITVNKGSVQHLDFLSTWDKDVFKTALEVNQDWVIQHAADRQPYICQGQSTNLFFPSNVNALVLHQVHWRAWELGLKTLYYCRSEAPSYAETVSLRVANMNEIVAQDTDQCLACEG